MLGYNEAISSLISLQWRYSIVGRMVYTSCRRCGSVRGLFLSLCKNNTANKMKIKKNRETTIFAATRITNIDALAGLHINRGHMRRNGIHRVL